MILLFCIISTSFGKNRTYIPFHHLLSHSQGVGGKYFNVMVSEAHQEITGVLKSWSQAFLTDVNWPGTIEIVLKNIRSIVGDGGWMLLSEYLILSPSSLSGSWWQRDGHTGKLPPSHLSVIIVPLSLWGLHPSCSSACTDFAVLMYEIWDSHYLCQGFILENVLLHCPRIVCGDGAPFWGSGRTHLSPWRLYLAPVISFGLWAYWESNSTDWFSWERSTEAFSVHCDMMNSCNWVGAFNISQKGKTKNMCGMVAFNSRALLLWWQSIEPWASCWIL